MTCFNFKFVSIFYIHACCRLFGILMFASRWCWAPRCDILHHHDLWHYGDVPFRSCVEGSQLRSNDFPSPTRYCCRWEGVRRRDNTVYCLAWWGHTLKIRIVTNYRMNVRKDWLTSLGIVYLNTLLGFTRFVILKHITQYIVLEHMCMPTFMELLFGRWNGTTIGLFDEVIGTWDANNHALLLVRLFFNATSISSDRLCVLDKLSTNLFSSDVKRPS